MNASEKLMYYVNDNAADITNVGGYGDIVKTVFKFKFRGKRAKIELPYFNYDWSAEKLVSELSEFDEVVSVNVKFKMVGTTVKIKAGDIGKLLPLFDRIIAENRRQDEVHQAKWDKFFDWFKGFGHRRAERVLAELKASDE